MAPWLVGIAPLGLVIGVTTARADSPACAGSLAGPLIFSASAQAVAIQLLTATQPPWSWSRAACR